MWDRNKFPFYLLFQGLLFFGFLSYVVKSNINQLAQNHNFMLESVLVSRSPHSQSQVLSDAKHKSLYMMVWSAPLIQVLQMSFKCQPKAITQNQRISIFFKDYQSEGWSMINTQNLPGWWRPQTWAQIEYPFQLPQEIQPGNLVPGTLTFLVVPAFQQSSIYSSIKWSVLGQVLPLPGNASVRWASEDMTTSHSSDLCPVSQLRCLLDTHRWSHCDLHCENGPQ